MIPFDIDRLDPLPGLGQRAQPKPAESPQDPQPQPADTFGWQLPFLDTGFKRRSIDERFGSAM